MKIPMRLVGLCLLAPWVAFSAPQEGGGGGGSPDDAPHIATILATLTQIDSLEVEVGITSQSHTKDGDIRNYGALLIRDQRQAQDRVEAVARDRNLDLNAIHSDSNAQAALDQAELEWSQIAALENASFDQAFWLFEVKANESALMFIDTHLLHIPLNADSDIKELLDEVRVVIVAHLTEAKEHTEP